MFFSRVVSFSKYQAVKSKLFIFLTVSRLSYSVTHLFFNLTKPTSFFWTWRWGIQKWRRGEFPSHQCTASSEGGGRNSKTSGDKCRKPNTSLLYFTESNPSTATPGLYRLQISSKKSEPQTFNRTLSANICNQIFTLTDKKIQKSPPSFLQLFFCFPLPALSAGSSTPTLSPLWSLLVFLWPTSLQPRNTSPLTMCCMLVTSLAFPSEEEEEDIAAI